MKPPIIILRQSEINRFTEKPFARLSLQNKKNLAIKILHSRGTEESEHAALRLEQNNPAYVAGIRIVAS